MFRERQDNLMPNALCEAFCKGSHAIQASSKAQQVGIERLKDLTPTPLEDSRVYFKK